MQLLITILLDGLVYASYLFIVSAGLTIIFGVILGVTEDPRFEGLTSKRASTQVSA